jgi:hypothetical protein
MVSHTLILVLSHVSLISALVPSACLLPPASPCVARTLLAPPRSRIVMQTMDDDDIEETLVMLDECFVYKIGAREGSSGHRAETWGLATPFRTCKLRVLSSNALAAIQLLDKLPTGDLKLFAACRISVSDALSLGLNYFLEPVSARAC